MVPIFFSTHPFSVFIYMAINLIVKERTRRHLKMNGTQCQNSQKLIQIFSIHSHPFHITTTQNLSTPLLISDYTGTLMKTRSMCKTMPTRTTTTLSITIIKDHICTIGLQFTALLMTINTHTVMDTEMDTIENEIRNDYSLYYLKIQAISLFNKLTL